MHAESCVDTSVLDVYTNMQRHKFGSVHIHVHTYMYMGGVARGRVVIVLASCRDTQLE